MAIATYQATLTEGLIMTTDSSFDWHNVKQLTIIQILLAVFIPSALAFIGFRVVLPVLFKSGIPAIIAWPIVASAMLAVFLIVAIILLKKEANALRISLFKRMLFKSMSIKKWAFCLLILILGGAVTVTFGSLSNLMTDIPGLSVPDYFPFFLNPEIDPANTDPTVLTPGISLVGAYWVLPLMAVTLFLNILTEELYFRAWLLPKMMNYGNVAWIMNGVLFGLYHSFQLWLLPQLIPISIVFAFVVFRSRSIWPAFLFHIVVNIYILVGVLALIAG
jgi:membrane protease YdiL (CAAX protease family)